jgi:hypothetical protein
MTPRGTVLGRVDTMTREAATVPEDPAVQVSARADLDKAREWWAAWRTLLPIERRRSAAEVLAEVRDDPDS